jgi:hypothetical protein
MLGASRGGIAGFAGSWIPGEVLPLQSPIQSTSLRGHNREVEEPQVDCGGKQDMAARPLP